MLPYLKPLDLPLHTVFFKSEETIERVYFPLSGIVSLVVGLSSGQFVEVECLGGMA
jgi:CRP-like cAMP-binding protein